MKLKGINPIEQHVEKIVVVLAGVALLAVIAQQFLTNPNEVKIGGDTVSAARAYEPVKRAANVLKSKLDASTPPLPDGFDSAGKDMKGEWEKLVKGAIAPRKSLPALGPAVALGATNVIVTDATFAEVALPQPAPAVAAAFWSTISPDETAAYPELAALLPKEQPFDHPFVSVESTIDIRSLVDSLQSDPDGAGPLEAMPQGWWREGIEAVSVEAEREQMKSDGSWGKGVVLPAMLGRHLFVVGWNENVKTNGDMQSELRSAREQASEILRPAFYKTLGAQDWVPPSAAATRTKAGADPGVIAAKQSELEKVRADLKTRREELEKLPKDEPKKPEAPKPTEKPAPGRAPTPKPPPTTPTVNNTVERTRLTNIINRLENRERLLAEEIARISPQSTGDTAPAGGAPAAITSLLSQDSVTFWMHDATAQPGERYRYRLRLGVNNPLFGRGMNLKEEQQSLAANSIIKSPWSEWSNAVDVDRAEYFFVTSATPDNDLGAARASVELYKFYFGHYRKQTAGMNIGDPLSGSINLPKSLASAPTAPSDTANPGTTAEAEAPASFTVPDNIRVTLDGVILLDVAPMPNASGTPSFVAVLRDINGQVIIRDPEKDRDSPLYKRIEASAKSAGG
ncbi:MAG: hypothetical protein KF691_03755 [Phycisphaeraceae bacterium]|nr:hypothetical protein [Phycisphaeraceae bacterium]